MTAAPRATFRKHERLCARTTIQRLLREGRAVNEAPLRLIGMIAPNPTPAPAQVAFAVPRRHLPRAVDRNRVRRMLREAYRLNKHRWYGRLEEAGAQCAWLVVFQGRTVPPYAVLQGKITRAIDRWLLEHVPPAR
jgi:ribonuclease P protein component